MIAFVFGRDQLLDEVEVEVPGRPLGVDRDRHGAVVVRGERGRDVRGRADEHFVSGRQVQRLHGEVESGRPARGRDPVARADEGRELLLERGQVLAERARDLAGANGRRHGLGLLLADERLVDRDHAVVSTTTSTLSTSSPKKGPCLTLRAWKSSITWIAWTPRMRTIASPGSRRITREEPAVVGVELDVDDAALDDEHLLEIVDPALEGLVVVRRLPVARLVREEAELEGRLRRREELRLLDPEVGADHLGVRDAVVLDNLDAHRRLRIAASSARTPPSALPRLGVEDDARGLPLLQQNGIASPISPLTFVFANAKAARPSTKASGLRRRGPQRAPDSESAAAAAGEESDVGEESERAERVQPPRQASCAGTCAALDAHQARFRRVVLEHADAVAEERPVWRVAERVLDPLPSNRERRDLRLASPSARREVAE